MFIYTKISFFLIFRLRKACSKCILDNVSDDNLLSNIASSNIENRKDKDYARRRFSSLPTFNSSKTNDEASKDYLLYILNNVQFLRYFFNCFYYFLK